MSPPSPVRRRLGIVVLLAITAALAVPRLAGDAPKAPGAGPPLPPIETSDPTGAGARPTSQTPTIAAAPAEIRTIELVAVSRMAFYHGRLDQHWGRTSLPAGEPYASDDVAVQAYGGGVVFGPRPGAPVPGPVRVFGPTADAPIGVVAGVVPAVGDGYWVMDAEPVGDGCTLRAVSADGALTGEVVGHPCAFVPERETVAGFVGRVGSRVDPRSGQLLDPVTGELTPIGGALLGSASAHLVRWSRELADPLVVEHLPSGLTTEVRLPLGSSTRQVALSPDGRYLAVVIVELLASTRSYEVWVHDLLSGAARVATVTTLDGRPLDLTWHDDVLIALGNGADAYDAATGALYQTTVDPMLSRLDVIALPEPLG